MFPVTSITTFLNPEERPYLGGSKSGDFTLHVSNVHVEKLTIKHLEVLAYEIREALKRADNAGANPQTD